MVQEQFLLSVRRDLPDGFTFLDAQISSITDPITHTGARLLYGWKRYSWVDTGGWQARSTVGIFWSTDSQVP